MAPVALPIKYLKKLGLLLSDWPKKLGLAQYEQLLRTPTLNAVRQRGA